LPFDSTPPFMSMIRSFKNQKRRKGMSKQWIKAKKGKNGRTILKTFLRKTSASLRYNKQ
jgi:hypothetical protein